jgi:hypothetical protein
MKRIILTAALVLAFTGAAQAEKYYCQVKVSLSCYGNMSHQGCGRQQARTKERYIIDTKSKTVAWCNGPKKSNCFPNKAAIKNTKTRLSAMMLGNSFPGDTYLNVGKFGKEFEFWALQPSGTSLLSGGYRRKST